MKSNKKRRPNHRPTALYADPEGNIFDAPSLGGVGRSGNQTFALRPNDLILLPDGADLMFLPQRTAVGMTNGGEILPIADCMAVAAILPPGYTRTFLPAFIKCENAATLPLYGYTAAVLYKDEIYAAAFSGEPWKDFWRTEDAEIHVREILDSKQSYGLEYVADGKIVGFLLGTSMLFHYGRTFEINDLAVLPEYQRNGIATKLLEHCLMEMKLRGIKGVHLITAGQGFLTEFYQRHGFQQERKVILMGLEL